MTNLLNIAGLVLIGAGLLLMIVRLAKFRMPDSSNNPLQGLPLQDRRRIMKSARGGQPIDDHNEATSTHRYIVWHMRFLSDYEDRKGPPMWAGYALAASGVALRVIAMGDASAGLRWIVWLGVLLVLGFAIWKYKQRMVDGYRRTAAANGWDLS